MKKFLLASAALAALSIGGNAVQAADMPVKYVAPAPVFSWTGCYVGVEVGYKWGTSKHTSTGAYNGVAQPQGGTDYSPWFNVNGTVGGFEGGCNYQFNSWVVGVEVDWSWSAADGQANYVSPPFNPFWTSRTSERWFGTARGRLGYAVDKWLWYVTAGVAWTGIDVGFNNLPATAGIGPTQAASASSTRSGWTVGYGSEYALVGGWSVKAETLYTSFRTFHAFDVVDTNPAGGVCPVGAVSALNCQNRDIKLREWVWRVGMNYKFDWGKAPAVVAKY